MEKNIKRSERRFNSWKQIRKQMNILKSYDMINSFTVAGKYSKHKALNCGRSRCIHCMNPRRSYGHKTLKEEIHDVVFKEAIDDLYS